MQLWEFILEFSHYSVPVLMRYMIPLDRHQGLGHRPSPVEYTTCPINSHIPGNGWRWERVVSYIQQISCSCVCVKNMFARGLSLSKFKSRNVYTSHVFTDGKMMGFTLLTQSNTRQLSGHPLLVLNPFLRKACFIYSKAKWQTRKIGQFAHNTKQTLYLVSFVNCQRLKIA